MKRLFNLTPIRNVVTTTFVDLTSTVFNASNQYITMGNVQAYQYSQPWTISAWIKASSLTQNFHTIVGKIANAAYQGYELQIKNQTITPTVATAGSNYFEVTTTSNVITSTSTWYHVVWVNDGSGVAAGQTIYINGSSVALTTNQDNLGGGSIINTGNDFSVGNRGDASAPFAGTIDDVSMFNAALNSTQVTTLYNSGAPGNLTGMANLQYWCWMGDGDTAGTMGGMKDHSGNNFNGSATNMTAANFTTDIP